MKVVEAWQVGLCDAKPAVAATRWATTRNFAEIGEESSLYEQPFAAGAILIFGYHNRRVDLKFWGQNHYLFQS